MTRLNQSRRQSIGYVYCHQKNNDVAIKPYSRQMLEVQEKAYDQNMTGQGMKDKIKIVGTKIMDFSDSDIGQQVGKIVFDKLPSDKQEQIKNLREKIPQPVMDKIKSKIRDKLKGNGLGLAGSGLGVAGSGLGLAGRGLGVAGSGLGLAGAGLGLAGAGLGGAIDIKKPQKEDVLPGDKLKKKLLQKMVREKKMKSIGDRVKTQPIEQGMNGGNLVIPTKNTKSGRLKGSQSRSKTLPSSKTYKLNPKPLVGAGINKELIIKILQSKLIPLLKENKLVSDAISNTDKIKKLIELRVNNIMKTVKDPKKVILNVITSLKPIMNKNMSGSGIGEKINKVLAMILASVFRAGNPDSAFAKGFDKLAGKGQKGGFIFAAIASAIAAISAAASTAAATTVVGGVTVGALAGSALTGAATAAGAAIVNKIASSSGANTTVSNATGDNKSGASEIKKKLVDVAKKTKLMLSELPKEDQEKIKNGILKLKENPSKDAVIKFAKSIAPMILKATKKKLQPKFAEVFKKAGMPGGALKLAGQGLGLAGKGAKTFKDEFVKNLVTKLS